jgi:RNA polymerase sigma-70 factor (ECF subfamily)
MDLKYPITWMKDAMPDDPAETGSPRPFHGGPLAGSFIVMSDRTFEALMSEHHAEIYRYILRVTGRRHDADDLSQETFLRAFRAHRTLPPDANSRAWLFAIATNLTRNHFRSQKRRRVAYQAVVTETRETDEERPDGVTLSQEIGTAVEHVVAKLPLKQRLAFLQRKVHGLEYDAIGQSLQCSAETARAHVFQALRKVRRALEGRELIGKEFAS